MEDYKHGKISQERVDELRKLEWFGSKENMLGRSSIKSCCYGLRFMERCSLFRPRPRFLGLCQEEWKERGKTVSGANWKAWGSWLGLDTSQVANQELIALLHFVETWRSTQTVVKPASREVPRDSFSIPLMTKTPSRVHDWNGRELL